MDNIAIDIKNALDYEVLSEFKPRFSASDFPYCAREHFIHAYLPKDRQVLQGIGFYSEFFMQQGTAIHRVIQNALGRSGLLFGNWKCNNSRCNNKTVIENSGGPQFCPQCKKYMDYVELELDRKLFNGMGGFVDGVIPKYNAVLEIKTKGKSGLIKLHEPIFNEWAFQASSYVNALNIQYNWSLDKIIMFYASRDNPRDYKIFVKDAVNEVLQDQINMKIAGDAAIVAKTIPCGICENMRMGTDEMYCLYAPICFSPALENMLVF